MVNTLSSARGGAVSAWEEQTPALSSQSLFLADDLQTNPLAGTREQSDTHTGRGRHATSSAMTHFGFFFFRADEGKSKKNKQILIKEPWS